jgi:hypothetical protein
VSPSPWFNSLVPCLLGVCLGLFDVSDLFWNQGPSSGIWTIPSGISGPCGAFGTFSKKVDTWSLRSVVVALVY